MRKWMRWGTAWTLVLSIAGFAAQPGAKLTIKADDLLRFDVVDYSVKSGTDLTVFLKNSGKIPTLKHNWVLLKPGTNLTQFGNAAMNAAGTGYIPESFRKAVLAHTPMAENGEEVSIRFQVPAKGAYPYICSFPGHFSLSRGILTAVD